MWWSANAAGREMSTDTAALIYAPDSREQRRYEERRWLTCHRCEKVGTEYEIGQHTSDGKNCDHGRGCALSMLAVARGY